MEFDECDDPDSLFDTVVNEPTLTIPTDYFSNGLIMIFEVTAEKGSISSDTTSIVEVKGAEIIPLQIICKSQLCEKYSPNLEFDFNATSSKVVDFKLLQVSWTIEPTIKISSFLNELKVKTTSSEITLPYLIIEINAINSTNIGSAKYRLPVNDVPSGGDISVTPTTGSSLSTEFLIEADSWTDSDAPLKYKFYFKSATKTTFTALSGLKSSNYMETFLSST